jgi:hypothetical protein
MHTDDEKELQEEQQDSTEATAETTAEDLDLDSLDLSVETVEERISPSETNVFDK